MVTNFIQFCFEQTSLGQKHRTSKHGGVEVATTLVKTWPSQCVAVLQMSFVWFVTWLLKRSLQDLRSDGSQVESTPKVQPEIRKGAQIWVKVTPLQKSTLILGTVNVTNIEKPPSRPRELFNVHGVFGARLFGSDNEIGEIQGDVLISKARL